VPTGTQATTDRQTYGGQPPGQDNGLEDRFGEEEKREELSIIIVMLYVIR
jgi:hypothetical protein